MTQLEAKGSTSAELNTCILTAISTGTPFRQSQEGAYEDCKSNEQRMTKHHSDCKIFVLIFRILLIL
jgi:hypothetical protein